MGLSSGTKLGPYEIVSPLGAGGMGEVYRARDTRLDRTVAIKVLPESLQDNPELKARFDREARAISSLQHPHICALFDVGHQGGTSFLVMEYLDGETLANRLLTGALPLDQVLKIGGELADALAKAHSQGILHRDVKPGNIMLTKTGSKLMDFGLAGGPGVWGKDLLSAAVSPLTPSTPTVDVSTLASAASPLTQKGTIVGTFQYLAPEVLQGKDADFRSDIFATGCVLYEMATGARAFQGKTHLSVMSAILEKDPDPISTLQPLTPVALASAIRTCLNKDPDDRWQTAADLRNVLSLVDDTTSQPAIKTAAKGISAKQALLAVLAAFALMLLAFGAGSLRRVPVSSVLSSDLNLPAGTILDTLNDPIAISPDGKKLALALLQADGKSHLWLRRLDTGQMNAVEGTVGAEYAFWSPDGTSIGFFADGKLKRADLSGSVVQDICDAPHGRGGTWNKAGTIVFAPDAYGGLSEVSSSGGTPTDLGIPIATSDSLRLPSFLPDGEHLLFLRFPQSGPSHIEGLSLADKQVIDLLLADAAGRFAPGYLVFVRGGNLYAQDFDPGRLRLSGQPSVIASGVQLDPARSTAAFSVSQAGFLIYAPGSGVSLKQLQWTDSTGKAAGNIGEPAGYYYALSLSSDDKLVAVGGQKGEADILDLATGMRKPFSNSGAPAIAQHFAWSPNGKWLAFTSEATGGHWAIYRKATDGRTESKIVHVCERESCMATSWSPDGQLLALDESTVTGSDNDVEIVSVENGQKLHLLPHAVDGIFSPDGKWLAFYSAERGKHLVFVTAMPPGPEKWQVSSEEASVLSWRTPGTLLYGTTAGKIAGVRVSANGKEFQVGPAETKFGGRLFPSDITWDVTLDGKRAVTAVPTEGASGHSLKLLQNWAPASRR